MARRALRKDLMTLRPQTPTLPTFEQHDRISEKVYHINKETGTVTAAAVGFRRGTIRFAGFTRPNIFGVASPFYHVSWDEDRIPDRCVYTGLGWMKIGHEVPREEKA